MDWAVVVVVGSICGLQSDVRVTGAYNVRSSATYSAAPDIYTDESILPWWTWLVALILVMFSVFMVIMCCLRYDSSSSNVPKTCYLCKASVPYSSWTRHRHTCSYQNGKIIQDLPPIQAKCDNCRGRLKVWPKDLGYPFICDNFACTKPHCRAEAPRYNCFVCDFNLCDHCVQAQQIDLGEGGQIEQDIGDHHGQVHQEEEYGQHDPPMILVTSQGHNYQEFQNPLQQLSENAGLDTFYPDTRRSYVCLPDSSSPSPYSSHFDSRLERSRTEVTLSNINFL